MQIFLTFFAVFMHFACICQKKAVFLQRFLCVLKKNIEKIDD